MLEVRASDSDREAAVRALHDGCAEGRLSAATLERRVEQALAADSVDELSQLTVDVKRVSRLRAWLSHTVARRPPVAGRNQPCLWLNGIGQRPFVLGRSGRADLVLGDVNVSRRHAQIIRTPDGFTLVDLGSTNGTWLEDRRVGQVEVAPGDVIELADVPVRLL